MALNMELQAYTTPLSSVLLLMDSSQLSYSRLTFINPIINAYIHAECSMDLGGEDDLALSGMEAQHGTNLQHRVSLMSSEGAQSASPSGSARAPSLSPPDPWAKSIYSHNMSLTEHMKMCPERESGHNICPLCGYTATHWAQMDRHMSLHHQIHEKNQVSNSSMENRKFKCLQCGKAFKYKHHLKEHLRIHSGEKPYECSHCKKRFSHSGSYSSHLSSKKCLSGGAVAGGGSGNSESYNGHINQASSLNPLQSQAAAKDSSTGKDSLYASDSQQLLALAQDHQLTPLQGSGLGRLWNPAADFALSPGILRGTTLLPYLHSGGKFEHLLQEMLQGAVGKDERKIQEEIGGQEEREKREGRSSYGWIRQGETPSMPGMGGKVMCRWCSQLFPSAALLQQHELYHCKMGRDIMPEFPHGKGTSPHSQDPQKVLSAIANGLPKDRLSPHRAAAWHSIPQQLLVTEQSTMQLCSEPLVSRSCWLNPDIGNPDNASSLSPNLEISSPSHRDRRQVPSSLYGSPVCLDLSANSSPQNRANPPLESPGSTSPKNEPLDLSLPKAQTDSARKRTCNGNVPHTEQRVLDSPFQKSRMTLQERQAGAGYMGTPVFGSSIYSTYPFINTLIPPGLGGMGQEAAASRPASMHPTPGFLSPVAYMLESDTDFVFKRIQRERHAMMGKAIKRGCLDLIPVMDEGVDGELGPGRRRLRKTDEGLYACDICDKTFQKSSSLLRHKYEHTGKRPHECKTCKKAFKHKHHLIEHSRLHSGEKPYQCDKCGKRFSHSGSYSQHMNHRYAFCSRDQDHEPREELSLGTGPYYRNPGMELDCGSRGVLLTQEDTPTILSDSSLDGPPDKLREEQEEEEDDEERLLSSHTKGMQDSKTETGEGGGIGQILSPRLKPSTEDEGCRGIGEEEEKEGKETGREESTNREMG
ncbi:zinc finger E-box-binding homeobox 2 [Chanos chanos]|uniref:Zinc finger E-box-binding homeobox 2 n=1 Tax=Chanos chanos TaxID=29144 RepID=A0A6J2VPT3_CHACN|nr:zinc finger E-box-binding homeobox 2-like [Chanos chanos]